MTQNLTLPFGQVNSGCLPKKWTLGLKQMSTFRNDIFISYARADRKWVDLVVEYLKPLLREEKIFLWDDGQIKPGDYWESELFTALDRSRIALLFVTPKYLASTFIFDVELPAILQRTGKDLIVFWILVEPSLWELTPLSKLQAVNNLGQPFSTLSKTHLYRELSNLAAKLRAAVDLSAIGNTLRIIDEFEPQVKAFVQGEREPSVKAIHSEFAAQNETTIKLVRDGSATQLITAKQLESWDEQSLILIRSYERSMRVLFERWTELKHKRHAEDPAISRQARERSKEVQTELCAELRGLLGFIESLGFHLRDHYDHVRYICSQNT